ncbi:DUF6461 domain-containing protein [Streptomyces sp. NBC_00576]|uniref:DUF6461 domain-containing protein n=1 Tax=Streptomyces sp. NBC_00576 TaxID=2903665 RepID=UPI002E8227AB|nr:DUF6461 domain-containing protein [Streptomyces sp. NBC_00576]WUB73224.1 DUF6461 domain-containing protein [Streptomyces sp. NBC_00576]
MTANTTDYLWFEERFPDLAEAYCITLVHGVSPVELLRRLGGQAEPAHTGIPELVEAAYDFYAPFSGTRTLFGMTSIGPWTLMVEPNGWHGVNEEKALPASLGTRWISHYDNSNANNDGSFLWAENTDRRLQFDLRDAGYLNGSRPDELLDVIRRLGFEFPEEPTTTDDLDTDRAIPAAFALAEHLTQIRLMPAHLQDTVFVCGSAEIK